MGRIPSEFIDELMSRTDIVEVIDSRVPLKKAGKEFTACCPFHSEKTPSFTVSPTKQFYHCFGCGAHGTAIGFLMEYERLEFVEAVEELAKQAGLDVPREGPARAPAKSENTTELYGLLEKASTYYRRQLREHPNRERVVSYLKGRGLSGEAAARFELGYAPPGWDNLLKTLGGSTQARRDLAKAGMLIEKDRDAYYDRFRDRVMFPIRDHRGRMIGFGGRVMSSDEQPKYLNSPETPVFHKGRELYGLYQARQALRNPNRMLVVEGYMDVVALAQHGIDYAVATLGTAITREHLERLARTAPEIVFCFDGDRAGRQAAWKAVETILPLLNDGLQVRFMFLPEGEDPDSMVRAEGKEGFEARIDHSVPFSAFFFETLTKQADIRSMDGRARLIELTRPLLVQLPVGALRDMMIARLAELAQMDVNRVSAHLGINTRLGMQTANAAIERGRPSRPVTPSPVRVAIALLLQRPGLAQLAGDPGRFADLQLPGVALLQQLLDLLQQSPHLTSGAILERWRGSEEGRQLAKIVRWEHLVPEAGIEAEFLDSLELLEQQAAEQRFEQLQQKSQTVGLNFEEKQLFRELSGRRRGSSTKKAG